MNGFFFSACWSVVLHYSGCASMFHELNRNHFYDGFPSPRVPIFSFNNQHRQPRRQLTNSVSVCNVGSFRSAFQSLTLSHVVASRGGVDNGAKVLLLVWFNADFIACCLAAHKTSPILWLFHRTFLATVLTR